jgi:hypothetical protein
MSLAAVFVLSAACGRDDPPVSSEAGSPALAPVPAHEKALPGQGSAPDHTAMHGEAAGGGSGNLAWTAPEGWIEEQPRSAMRKAQYRLAASPGDKEDGECVVSYFGAGQGGDVKSNLDRWAGQFAGGGSTPKFSLMKAGGLTIDTIEVRGTYTSSPMLTGGGPKPGPKPNYMLLGAIVPGADANWFFKCTGPEKTMETNRVRFEELLASVRPAP